MVSGIKLLDFVLEIAQHDGQGYANLHYNTDLFDKATAQRMLGHFMVSMPAQHRCIPANLPGTYRVFKIPGAAVSTVWYDSSHVGNVEIRVTMTQASRNLPQELCSSAVAHPDHPAAQLNLITAPEVTQVLKTFNAWDLPYTNLLNPEQQTIHGMFEHWARHTPEQASLTFAVRPLHACDMQLPSCPIPPISSMSTWLSALGRASYEL